ncbi:protein ripply3 isoform X1 [Erinaceus europaeus]|uniref:Protein ripply3 n=1 Tax=Erinaceus europaeus TaxID=9365 RepID=A0ABM3Y0U4_ERIEU|nr:protein ripply3 isoform X1 [Erinaceus europaeus]
MDPEATRAHVWPLGPRRPPPAVPDSPTLWRPWVRTARDAELEPGGDQQPPACKGAFGFQHPVRLYLPLSKRQECLQNSGAQVLASFPVQATLHFYNDASDSEEEEEEEDKQEEAAQACPAQSLSEARGPAEDRQGC